jgi:hypothetical protein
VVVAEVVVVVVVVVEAAVEDTSSDTVPKGAFWGAAGNVSDVDVSEVAATYRRVVVVVVVVSHALLVFGKRLKGRDCLRCCCCCWRNANDDDDDDDDNGRCTENAPEEGLATARTTRSRPHFVVLAVAVAVVMRAAVVLDRR